MQFLKCLVASNMRLVVVSKDFEDQTDAEERWYKTKYKATPFTDAQKAAWGDLKSVSTEMHLPAPNDFIATDFSLRFDEDTTNAAVAPEPRMVLGLPVPETIEPTIVRDDALARLWYVRLLTALLRCLSLASLSSSAGTSQIPSFSNPKRCSLFDSEHLLPPKAHATLWCRSCTSRW